MKYLELLRTSHSVDTSEADPNDSWDRPNTYTTHRVEGLRLCDKDGYGCLPVDDDIKSGDTLWVLYAIYSTGDSFGHDEGGQFEWLSWHRTEELAQKNLSAIEAGASSLTLDNGKRQDFYRGWDGYFESLDSLEVKPLIVE